MIKILQKFISVVIDYLVEKPFIKSKLNGKNVERIIDLYSTTDYTRNFVKFRFWFGPLHEINKLTPKQGNILDIGSGEGILANFLALSSKRRKITGVEISKHRVKEANKGISNIRFIANNVFKVKLRKSDVIVVSHVFHHLGSKELQEKLLDRIFNQLKTNGKLVVAEVDREFSLRYLFGFFVDVFLVPIFFEKKFIDWKIYHRSRKDWKKLFLKHEFKIVKQTRTKDRIYPEVIFQLTKVNK